MAIRKRGKTWQIDYFDASGRRVRVSPKKRKEAEAELAKRQSLIAKGRYLDVKRETPDTLADPIKAYEKNYGQQTSYRTGKRWYVQLIEAYFGQDRKLSSIKYIDLETFRTHLREQPATLKNRKNEAIGMKLRATASVNRGHVLPAAYVQEGRLWTLKRPLMRR